jgi:death-on-curing protein
VSSPSSPIWIAVETVLAIHDAVIAEHGGSTGIRDRGLLESALARPINAAQYGEPPPDVPELAALYAVAVSRNHPFVDGNKRVAYVLLETFLELNGYTLPVADAEAIAMMWSLAAGDETDATFVGWVRENAVLSAD